MMLFAQPYRIRKAISVEAVLESIIAPADIDLCMAVLSISGAEAPDLIGIAHVSFSAIGSIGI